MSSCKGRAEAFVAPKSAASGAGSRGRFSNVPCVTWKSTTASAPAGISSRSAGTYVGVGCTMYRGAPAAVRPLARMNASTFNPSLVLVTSAAAQRKFTVATLNRGVGFWVRRR